MINQRTTIMWVVIAVVLFTVLLGARSLVGKVAYGGPDVNAAYDELAVALEQTNLLPLGRDDQYLMNLAHLAKDIGKVHPQDEPSMSGDILTIGTVLEARSKDQVVIELRLRPKFSNELLPGSLPSTLRKINGIPRKAQVEAGPNSTSNSKASQPSSSSGNSAASSQSASGASSSANKASLARFTFTVAHDRYECLALFTGDSLDELLIKKK